MKMSGGGKRSGTGRRAAKDRRSGTDKRSDEEKRRVGERRSGVDRRSGKDRRSEKGTDDPTQQKGPLLNSKGTTGGQKGPVPSAGYWPLLTMAHTSVLKAYRL